MSQPSVAGRGRPRQGFYCGATFGTSYITTEPVSQPADKRGGGIFASKLVRLAVSTIAILKTAVVRTVFTDIREESEFHAV